MVGATGFEPATTCTPSKCATRLRYAPTKKVFAGRKRIHDRPFDLQPLGPVQASLDVLEHMANLALHFQ